MDANQVNHDENLLKIAVGLKQNFEAAMQMDLSVCQKETVMQYIETLAPVLKQFSFYLMDVSNSNYSNPKY